MRRMASIAAIALALGMVIFGPAGHLTNAHAAPPPHCLPYPQCLHCPDPSGICPPDGASPAYAWQQATTGTETDQEFTGSSLPSGWFAQSSGPPGGCYSGCTDTWSAAQTVVGGGVVSMATRCTTSGCLSGGIGQDQSAYDTTAGEATAIEARVTGATSGGTGSTSWATDNVMQMSQYCSGCTWPPEIDFMENGTGSLSSYNMFLHCYSGPNQQFGDPDGDGESPSTGDTDNDGDEADIAQQQNAALSLNVGAWTTYEVDWTNEAITVYAVQSGVARVVVQWLRADLDSSFGYYDTACNTYWPPTPHAALGLFFQSQIVGHGNPTSGAYGLQIDWIAQKALG
jgi:hypothetical protein